MSVSLIYAVCPECGARRDLRCVPGDGAPWPRCDDCDEMMQVFAARSAVADRHRARQHVQRAA